MYGAHPIAFGTVPSVYTQGVGAGYAYGYGAPALPAAPALPVATVAATTGVLGATGAILGVLVNVGICLSRGKKINTKCILTGAALGAVAGMVVPAVIPAQATSFVQRYLPV